MPRPELGHTSQFSAPSAISTGISVVGPFTPGQIVDRLDVVLGHTGINPGRLLFTAGVSGSSQTNAANVDASRPLIERSNTTLLNVLGIADRPAIEVLAPVDQSVAIVLGVGLRVVAGAEWIVWVVASTDPDDTVFATVSASVVGRRRLLASPLGSMDGEGR